MQIRIPNSDPLNPFQDYIDVDDELIYESFMNSLYDMCRECGGTGMDIESYDARYKNYRYNCSSCDGEKKVLNYNAELFFEFIKKHLKLKLEIK